MRTYSFFSIVMLCLGIFVVDVLAFYWLKSITQYLPSQLLRSSINIAFWFFTFGLITAILILKIRLAYIGSHRKHLLVSSLYGLTVSSFLPKLIFVIIISILYFTNYMFSERESIIIVPLIGLFSGFLPFFMIVYSILKGVYKFKVHTVHIGFKDLPQEFSGIRIVHISDIHLGSFNARYPIFNKAVDIINRLEPDFIFFTGDLVNNYATELYGWKPTFKNLQAKKGKYSVLGNHDYGDYSEWETRDEKKQNFDRIKAFHKEIGFNLLLNESEIFKIDNSEIAIIGVENWGAPPFKQYGDLNKAIRSVDHIPFKILLSHDPSHWSLEVIEKTNISLTLSGHTHGMQAGIQFRTKKWSPIKYKYKHWAGLYQHLDQYLYVTRGLGWLGFPGRLGMRPEITCINFK